MNTKLIAYGVGLLLLLFIVYKFLQKIHLIPTQEDETARELGNKNFWSPSFYIDAAKQGKKPVILTQGSARRLSDEIWDSKGVFNDDEDAVYGVFRQLKNRAQISFLSEYFFRYKNRDLYEFLNTFMSNEELAKLSDRLSQLPAYK